jgi:hypothetical protein
MSTPSRPDLLRLLCSKCGHFPAESLAQPLCALCVQDVVRDAGLAAAGGRSETLSLRDDLFADLIVAGLGAKEALERATHAVSFACAQWGHVSFPFCLRCGVAS